ncbi:MAG TPA: hypothetical protein VNW89_01060 [Stellaceae bacterium]|jgi:hypothetical protein|nr:hypothetical protein [Stellaceae bacterium]
MVETVQWRRWITKHHTRQSAPAQAYSGDFSVILMLSLSGLALSLFAIRQGWLGDAEYLTGLILLLQ